ncbi:membrane protein PM19L-like isoform X2 [Mangifera indica]|uniref:membrane protein PM19L-like isoform X2 n=1 Tax=Mangifera indica TaxID=29780 RepID=UPI001CFACDB0|nr:membrane protein PM19L-like isoform X2 [Mangifera indica]
MNRAIDHVFIIAAVVVATSAIAGENHIRKWNADSLPSAVTAATIAWSLRVLPMGFACKDIQLHIRNAHLRTMEALLIILSASQLLYLATIHTAATNRRSL